MNLESCWVQLLVVYSQSSRKCVRIPKEPQLLRNPSSYKSKSKSNSMDKALAQSWWREHVSHTRLRALKYKPLNIEKVEIRLITLRKKNMILLKAP